MKIAQFLRNSIISLLSFLSLYLFINLYGIPEATFLTFAFHGNYICKIIIKLIIILLFYFISKYFFMDLQNKFSISIFLNSLLFAAILIIGAAFKRYQTLQIIIDNLDINLFLFIIININFYMLISILYKLLQGKNKTYEHFDCSIKKLWCLFLICWLPYFILCFPGNITWDSVNQIGQLSGLIQNDGNNPAFQTFLINIFLFIGKCFSSDTVGVFLYTLLQFLLMIAILIYGIEICSRLRITKKVLMILLIFLLFNPIFPIYALTVGKDTSFALAILLYTLLLIKYFYLIDFKNIKKLKFQILILSLLLCLLRNIGVVLVLLMITFMFFIDPYKKKNENVSIMIIIIAFQFTYNSLILPCLGIPKPESKENLSIPFQQTARYVKYHQNEITQEEIRIYNEVLDYNALSTKYNPELSDPIKDSFKSEASSNDIKNYFNLWFEQLKKDPGIYLAAPLNNCYGYFYPFDKGNQKKYIQIGYAENIEKIKNIKLFNNPLIPYLNSFMNKFQIVPLFSIFTRIGNYSFLLIFLIFYFKHTEAKKDLYLCLPTFMVLLGCCASPVNAYFRYALPIIFTVPFLLCLLFKKNDKKGINQEFN